MIQEMHNAQHLHSHTEHNMYDIRRSDACSIE